MFHKAAETICGKNQEEEPEIKLLPEIQHQAYAFYVTLDCCLFSELIGKKIFKRRINLKDYLWYIQYKPQH